MTTPWLAKYIHAENGVPPAQPAPQRRPQHARMSLTERDTFFASRYRMLELEQTALFKKKTDTKAANR